MSEWISVDDKKPNDGREYLIYSDGKASIAAYWGTIGKWLSADVRVSQGAEVTHWMPLPESPE